MNRFDRRMDNDYCMLDGAKCTRCFKCEHMPVVINESKQSSNWIIKFLLAIIIGLVLILLFSSILSTGTGFVIDLIQHQGLNYDTSSSTGEDYGVAHQADYSNQQNYQRSSEPSTSRYGNDYGNSYQPSLSDYSNYGLLTE